MRLECLLDQIFLIRTRNKKWTQIRVLLGRYENLAGSDCTLSYSLENCTVPEDIVHMTVVQHKKKTNPKDMQYN